VSWKRSSREGVRLLLTQRRTTRRPDAVVWRIGIGMVPVVAVLAGVVIPLGGSGAAAGDLDIGVVWWTAWLALLWVALYLVGWGGNSAYALVGGYRFVAQALAYEMPLAITVITVALAGKSLRVGAIVESQQTLVHRVYTRRVRRVSRCRCRGSVLGAVRHADGQRSGRRCDSRAVGVDRLIFLAGRYLVLVVVAAFAVPLFLGGGAGPLLPDWAWVLIKTLAVLAVLVWARRRLPAARMDRFEEFAWVVLIPVTLVQLFVVCAVVLWTGG
jgi:NADH-quinone oxidoreductase subunit H